MYTIQQSGRFYLETPLQASPSGTNRNVIKVTANNVTLDLNGMTISQINTIAGLNGIDVASGVSNLIIMNGFINNLSDVGVNVGTNCHNIRVINVKVSNCDGGGLQFNTAQNISLKNVDATNCNGTGTTAPGNDAVGLYMTTCDSIIIENCNFDSNIASGTRPAYGMYLATCNDGTVKNCSASSNTSVSSDCNSFYLTSCNGFNLKNCTASSNSTTTSGACNPFHLSSCNSTNLINCKSLSNSSADGISGIYLTGCNSCLVEECESNYNVGSSNEANGYNIPNGQGNIIKKCKAIGNSVTGASCYGIRLNTNETGAIIDQCLSANNTTTTSGTVYGIHIANTSTNNIATNNIMLNNVGAGDDYGYYDATASGTGTTTMLGGNVSFGHGACSPGDGTNLSNSTGGGNYYFQLKTPASGTNSPDKMIQEIKIGQLAESGTGRITTEGFIGNFGTFDNLSLTK